MELILFVSTFILIVNRGWIRSFIEGFTTGRPEAKDLTDPKLLMFVKEKSGLTLQKIKLLDTKYTWAMMAGLPTMPYMVLSKDAYENFSKDELEWVLLHEAGHYVLWHNVKLIILNLCFIIFGSFILMSLTNSVLIFAFAVLLAILFAAIYTQIARRFEYEANYYALSKMNNPKGIKNIYEKAKNRWRKKNKKDGLKEQLFNVWILKIYEDLVQKARLV